MHRLCFLLLIALTITGFSSTSGIAQEIGLASYYSDDFQGRTTAYGEKYDKNALTAAHKVHPLGTRLRVTRLDNTKQVIVRVNDKGPYIKGRIVDLSKAAALKLDLVRDGVAEVKVEVVSGSSSPSTPPPATSTSTSGRSSSTTSNASNASSSRPSSTSSSSESRPTSSTTTSRSASTPVRTQPVVGQATTPTATPATTTTTESNSRLRLVRNDFRQYGLYKIELHHVENSGYGVQVATMSNYENALKQISNLQGKWFENIIISVEPGTDRPKYKVILGPFDSREKAQSYVDSMKSRYKINGFVVDLAQFNYNN